jgi:hypothetical protein
MILSTTTRKDNMTTTIELEKKLEVRRAIDALVEFFNEAQVLYTTKHFPNLNPDKYWVHGGRKYISIVNSSAPESYMSDTNWTIHCFIDSVTGDVYKPATWRKPALNGARFNILDEDSLNELKSKWDPYGSYLYKR